MIQYIGNNGLVKIFTDAVEETAMAQIIELANSPLAEGAQIRIMPDVHAGAGSTIGTTIKLPEDRAKWRVSPNIVGVDIGCGMTSLKLRDFDMDLAEFDEIVNEVVPSGTTVHENAVGRLSEEERELLKTLRTGEHDTEWIERSIGTMGGGNHFIELGVGSDGMYWLTVHSGSRKLGVEVARKFQKRAEVEVRQRNNSEVIQKLKAEGREREIESELKRINAEERPKVRKELSYLTGDSLLEYLKAMDIAQKYATKNRATMLNAIVQKAGLSVVDKIDSIHNYIDIDNGIIRKGATSAQAGERLLIPINMKDGMIIGRGYGNIEWNCSAPHGAGRILKRSTAKEVVDLDEYVAIMEGVYSSSIGEATKDESPFAYKSIEDITKHIENTVEIDDVVKPVYNFKANS